MEQQIYIKLSLSNIKMPIIPYVCKECLYEGDAIVKQEDKPTECEGCGGDELIRSWSGYSTHGRTESKTREVPKTERVSYAHIGDYHENCSLETGEDGTLRINLDNNPIPILEQRVEERNLH